MNEELKTNARELLRRVATWARELAQRAAAWAREHRAAAAGICAGLMVVVVAIAFACSLSGSVQRLQQTGQQLGTEYEELALHLASRDAEGASQDAASIQELSDAMERETAGWAWGLAQVLPVAGDDACIARTLTSANRRLAHDATAPLVAGYAEYAESSLLGMPADPQAASALLEEIRSIRPVVNECSESIQGLGPAHSKQLQSVLENAKGILGSLDTGISELDTLLSTTSGIGDTITSLLP